MFEAYPDILSPEEAADAEAEPEAEKAAAAEPSEEAAKAGSIKIQ